MAHSAAEPASDLDDTETVLPLARRTISVLARAAEGYLLRPSLDAVFVKLADSLELDRIGPQVCSAFLIAALVCTDHRTIVEYFEPMLAELEAALQGDA